MSGLTRREKVYQALQSWASIAPLMACILGPLSILLGIPALSQRWRGYVVDNAVQYTLPDPALNIILASFSLLCEVLANALLMLRFSAIAVRVTTVLSLALWIAKVAICLGNYVQFIIVHPQPHNLAENWVYLEGFWIGCASMVISTIVIIFLILNLTISPVRYDLGVHEKAIMEQHRAAHQGFMFRVLILVLAMGFGSLAFCKLEHISFVTALYFVTASILTVGFGDVVLVSPASKIILFPYLVFSITYVALMVSSIAGLIDERLDAQKQLREHLRQVTKQTTEQQKSQLAHALAGSSLFMVPTSSGQAQDSSEIPDASEKNGDSSTSSSQNSVPATKLEIHHSRETSEKQAYKTGLATLNLPLQRTMTLQEEIELQAGTVAREEHRRQIRNIFLALFFFSIFWFVGAIVFAYSEGWVYGESLYFCYVFFMTVGYGDYSPKSQLGRCLFIVYAMIAVPTVTFLVQVFVEAADVKKYVYNSKKSRQHRINELDTRELQEIKKHITLDDSDKYPIGLRRTRSLAPSTLDPISRSRTLSRSVTVENERAIVLTQTIHLNGSASPRAPRARTFSVAVSDSPFDTATDGPQETDDVPTSTLVNTDSDSEEEDETELAAQVLQAEITSRSKLIQNARKLDHLTRLLISPHLHHEARLLLSLEMGRLDSHYKQLLRRLSQSHDGRTSASREWMEDTKEAEWIGLTGIERERKFVLEYRECFASLLNEVENLVGDVTPITSMPLPTAAVEARNDTNIHGLEIQEMRESDKADRKGPANITWAH